MKDDDPVVALGGNEFDDLSRLGAGHNHDLSLSRSATKLHPNEVAPGKGYLRGGEPMLESVLGNDYLAHGNLPRSPARESTIFVVRKLSPRFAKAMVLLSPEERMGLGLPR